MKEYDDLTIPVVNEILTYLPSHYFYYRGTHGLLINSSRIGFVGTLSVLDGQLYVHRDVFPRDDNPWIVPLCDPDCFRLAALKLIELIRQKRPTSRLTIRAQRPLDPNADNVESGFMGRGPGRTKTKRP